MATRWPNLLAPRLAPSARLAFSAMAFAILLGIPLGALGASSRAQGAFARLLTGLSLAIPVYWIATLAVAFAAEGNLSASVRAWLPVLTLGFAGMGSIARLIAGEIRAAMNADFARVARAKGLSATRVRYVHVLRVAMLPAISVCALQLGWLMGGAVMTETIFHRVGLGRLLLNRVLFQDYPVVQGIVGFHRARLRTDPDRGRALLSLVGSAHPGDGMNTRPLLILTLLAFFALVAPALAPHDPRALSGDAFLAPGPAHWLGTDQLGRDVLSRLLAGAQRSLGISALATALAAFGGVSLGILAARPAAIHSRMLRAILDALLALPSLLWSLVVITLLGNGQEAIIIAVGSAQIAAVARVVYARALSVNARDFVLAARALGAHPNYILSAHILPNCLTVIGAYTTVVFSYSLLNSAALTFLGLAGSPGVADWGVLLSEGRAAISRAPWIAISAGAAISLSVILINHLADRLTERP